MQAYAAPIHVQEAANPQLGFVLGLCFHPVLYVLESGAVPSINPSSGDSHSVFRLLGQSWGLGLQWEGAFIVVSQLYSASADS